MRQLQRGNVRHDEGHADEPAQAGRISEEKHSDEKGPSGADAGTYGRERYAHAMAWIPSVE